MSQLINNMNLILNGGKGSGNFGHSGRPGMVGGSGDGHGSSKTSTSKSRTSSKSKKDVPEAKAKTTLKEIIKDSDLEEADGMDLLRAVSRGIDGGSLQRAFADKFSDVDAARDGEADFTGIAKDALDALDSYPQSKDDLKRMRKKAHDAMNEWASPVEDFPYDERDWSSEEAYDKYITRIEEADEVLHAAIDDYCDKIEKRWK